MTEPADVAVFPPHPAQRPRRIAFVVFGMGRGGAERVICRLSDHWVREGHAVSVVTLNGANGREYPLPDGVTRIALGLAADSRNPLAGLARSLGRLRALRAALLQTSPDVVLSFMPQVNVLTTLAMAGTGVPVVVCERTDPRRAPLAWWWERLRRRVYPRAAAVVVQTEDVASWAREFCPRVHVVPNLVERPAKLATDLDPRGPKRIVALGRLEPPKGFELLIEAFAGVASGRPDWTLEILGEGTERPRLEALRRALRLEERVMLPGHVTDPIERLRTAQLFVLSSRYEGFPNALLEAMACGLPVVSFDCDSGPRHIVTSEKDGLLVPAEDVAALREALARLMDSPDERARMGHNARAIADRLGPARVLPLWGRVIEQVSGDSDAADDRQA